MKKLINNSRQLKIGAILSYLLIIFNTIYGLVLSPYILMRLGDSGYGVYKTIASFSSALLVLDLGIGTTIMRYTAKYRAEKNKEEIGNFAALGLIEAAIMALILLIVSGVIFSSIDNLYGQTFNYDEIILAKTIFVILVLNMVLTIIENVFNGIIMGSNEFVFTNGFKLMILILRVILIYIVLYIWSNAVALVSISLLLTVTTICVHLYYIRRKLKIKIKLIHFDKGVFKESLGYTSLMFVQTIAIQVNGNIDNIVIGAVVGSTAVAIYSFGIQMFNMYESLATSFSNLMLPSVSVKIANGANDEEMQELVTRIGRMQFLVLGAVLAGFICLGKEFISLWLGSGFEDVYYLSLIMMIPVTFTLIENVCLSILRARNMMRFRTFSLIVTAVFNGIVTVIGTIYFNYYAAAIGTGLSICFGSITMMNVYYHKHLGFKVGKFYKDVLSRLLLCATVPAVIIYALSKVMFGSWSKLIIKIALYCVIYAVLLLFYGMNKTEKSIIFGKFVKK